MEKRKKYCSGIVRLPEREISPEEAERLLKEAEEERFSPFYGVGGRFGNIRIPFDNKE